MSAWPELIALDDTKVENADVAIIGSTAPAYVLAEGLAASGARVVVLHRHKTVGNIASLSGTGHAFVGLTESAARLAQSLGESRCSELFELSRRGIDTLVGLGLAQRVVGRWRAGDAREGRELSDSALVLSRLGSPAQFDGEVLQIADEALLDPHRALAGLAQRAQAAGAVLMASAPVLRVCDHGVTTPHGTIHCDVVVACGDLDDLQAHPFFAPTLLPYREHAALYDVQGNTPVERAQYAYFTTRSHPRGTLVRGARWTTQHMEAGEREPVTLDKVQSKIDGFVQQHLIDAPRATDRWAWIETTTCDGLPLVGPLSGAPRLHACTGFGPSQWALGVGAALALVEGLVGQSAHPPAGLTPSRMAV